MLAQLSGLHIHQFRWLTVTVRSSPVSCTAKHGLLPANLWHRHAKRLDCAGCVRGGDEGAPF